MQAIDVLRGMYGRIYPMLMGEVAELSLDDLKHTHPGATIGSMLDTFVHTIMGDDLLVNVMTRGVAPMWATGDWSAKTGIVLAERSADPATVAAMDASQWAAFLEFAAAVRASTEAYLASASDDEMARMVNVPFLGRDMAVADFLGQVSVFHMIEHAAEISALRGVMGKSGMRG